MFTILGVLAVIAGIGSYLTERVDRPRRRQMRIDATAAE